MSMSLSKMDINCSGRGNSLTERGKEVNLFSP
jgi:hypothetical protein